MFFNTFEGPIQQMEVEKCEEKQLQWHHCQDTYALDIPTGWRSDLGKCNSDTIVCFMVLLTLAFVNKPS